MSAQPDQNAFRRAMGGREDELPDPAIAIPAILSAADQRSAGDGRAMAHAIARAWRFGERDIEALATRAVNASDRMQEEP